MKTFRLVLPFMLALACLALAWPAREAPLSTVTMPIVVGGADGNVEGLTVEASDVSGVDTLFLRLHSPHYPPHRKAERGYSVTKVSIRLNGGAWQDLDNTLADCLYPESVLGCLESPYHTLRLKVATDDLGVLSDGSNQIDFRFNYPALRDTLPAEVSSGFRVLNVDLWNDDAENTSAIDGTTFAWDDPSTWSAPAGASAFNGEDLWRDRNSLVTGFGAGDAITAACSDCHAEDGYDLAYFAYSNRSIVDRAKFHGLTEAQGEDIAAYIRSIEITRSNGDTTVAPGRPWEPPYQPGPTALASREQGAPGEQGAGFDEIDEIYWAAGAGNAWVFELDTQTFPYAWPGGVSYSDVDPDQRQIDLYEIPVAIQFPDWNEWLPIHHPLDARPTRFTDNTAAVEFCNSTEGRVAAWDFYNDEWLPVDGSTDWNTVDSRAHSLTNKMNNWRRCNQFWEADDSPDAIHAGDANISMMQWVSVKLWEKAVPYHHQTVDLSSYPDATELGWPGKQRHTFNIAPHIIKQPDTGDKDDPAYQVPKAPHFTCERHYYDEVWYYVAPVLDAGKGIHTGIQPVDWKYTHMFRKAFQGHCSYGSSQRYFLNMAKQFQLSELTREDASSTNHYNGDPNPDEPEGWYLRHTNLHWFWSRNDEPKEDLYAWNLEKAASGASCHVQEQLIRLMTRGMTPEDMSRWTRQEGRRGIEPESYTPSTHTGGLKYDNETYADHFIRWPSDMAKFDISSALQDSLMGWADAAWPGGDFTGQVQSGLSCPSLGSHDDNDARTLTTLNSVGGPTDNTGSGGGGDEGPASPVSMLLSEYTGRTVGNADGGLHSSPDYIEGVRLDDYSQSSVLAHTRFVLSDHNVFQTSFDSVYADTSSFESFAGVGLWSSTDTTATGCEVRVSPYSTAPRGAVVRGFCRLEDGTEVWADTAFYVRASAYARIRFDSNPDFPGGDLHLETRSAGEGSWRTLRIQSLALPDTLRATIRVFGDVERGVTEQGARLRAYVPSTEFYSE